MQIEKKRKAYYLRHGRYEPSDLALNEVGSGNYELSVWAENSLEVLYRSRRRICLVKYPRKF